MNEDNYSSKGLTEIELVLHRSNYQLFGFPKCSSSSSSSSLLFFASPPQTQAGRIIPGLALLFLPARVQADLCSPVLLRAAGADLLLQPGLWGEFDSSEQTGGAAGSPSEDAIIAFDSPTWEFAQGDAFPRAMPSPASSSSCQLTACTPGLRTAKCWVQNAPVLNNNTWKWSLPTLPFPFSSRAFLLKPSGLLH